MTRVGGTPVEPNGGDSAYPEEERQPLVGGYFVSAYPPFSFWSDSGSESYEALLGRSAPASGFGLYLHVPFCAQRCHYCYYLSHDDRPEAIERYLGAVERELDLCAAQPYLRGRSAEFVYFGGGTPSLLSEARIRRLLGAVQSRFPWHAAREVTFECAPRSVTAAKLEALRELGVTRLSIGAQQLADEVLRLNGRIHQVEDIERAFELAREVGFEVINVDLIAGLLGETDRSFGDSLGRLLTLAPDSVTIYLLEIPHNTPLFRSIRGGALQAPLPGWDVKRVRLDQGFARLESAGYILRSAYTAVRDPERHGFVYQDAQYSGADLLGVGVSSFSYLGGVHHQNIATLGQYVDALEAGLLPLGRAYALDAEELLVRELVLQLKLGRVDLRRLHELYSIDPRERFAGEIEVLVERGLVAVEGEWLTLTRQGLLSVDSLVRDFYLPQHRDVGARGGAAGICLSTRAS
jgi:oxygen-independent coproporphyrinogen-3 oxidase